MEDNYKESYEALKDMIPRQVKRTIIVWKKESQNLQWEIRYLEDLIDLKDKLWDIVRNDSLLKETEG